MLNRWIGRQKRRLPEHNDQASRSAQPTPAPPLGVDDRIVVSNGVDLAVALRLPTPPTLKPLVIAKVQGVAAVKLFLQNAERLYERVYDDPALTRAMYDTVPLLQRVTDDVQNQLNRMCAVPK